MRSGLDELLPRGKQYAEVNAGWSNSTGAKVRGEAGFLFGPAAAAYLFGQWTPQESSAGIGVRVTW